MFHRKIVKKLNQHRLRRELLNNAWFTFQHSEHVVRDDKGRLTTIIDGKRYLVVLNPVEGLLALR